MRRTKEIDRLRVSGGSGPLQKPEGVLMRMSRSRFSDVAVAEPNADRQTCNRSHPSSFLPVAGDVPSDELVHVTSPDAIDGALPDLNASCA